MNIRGYPTRYPDQCAFAAAAKIISSWRLVFRADLVWVMWVKTPKVVKAQVRRISSVAAVAELALASATSILRTIPLQTDPQN